MRSFIFDFNGTLFPDTPMHLLAWRAFFERHGIRITDWQFYDSMCGPPNTAIIRQFIRPDLTDAEVFALSEEKEAIYRHIVMDDEANRLLTSGAPEMLDTLAERGVPFAIATGSDRANCEFYIRALGIDRWFDFSRIFYAVDGMPGKPDPAIYRMAMEKMGYSPRDTVVVEDGLAGIHAAIGAGVESIIAIDTTLGPDAFAAITEVRHVIHDFHNFERFIDN